MYGVAPLSSQEGVTPYKIIMSKRELSVLFRCLASSKSNVRQHYTTLTVDSRLTFMEIDFLRLSFAMVACKNEGSVKRGCLVDLNIHQSASVKDSIYYILTTLL